MYIMATESTRSVEVELNGVTNVPNELKPNKANTVIGKIKRFLSNITVEPIYALSIFPAGIANLAVQNLNLEKACRVNLQLNDSICYGLSIKNQSMYDESDEVMVQKYVASVYAWKNVIQSIIPAILLMVLGSWSDRNHRRKPCILIPMLGESIASILYIVCTYFFYQLPLEYTILAESIPPALSGGWFVMNMGIYSYVAEITSVENRTVRMGALSTCANVSWTGGIALSGILYFAIGYYGIFSLSLTMYVFGLLYGYIRVNDVHKAETMENANKVGFLRDFFDIKHIKETFNVTFKSGPNKRRKKILLLILLMMIVEGPVFGELSILYLFVRYRFQWTEIEHSIFQTYLSLAYSFATIFVLYISAKYLKLDDALLGLIASVSKVISGFIYAFAPNSTIFYIGVLVEMFNGTSFVAVRTIISKLVPADELGRINSILGIFQALMPLACGPMYSLLYRFTIDIIPGSFFLLGSAITFPGIIIFSWFYFEHKRDSRQAKQNE